MIIEEQDIHLNFSKWLKKRVKANRFHFIKSLNLENWPTKKFLEYKGNLYIPLRLEWPEGRDHGMLYVHLVGSVRKLQKGPSTDIVPLTNNQIRIQISKEYKKRKTRLQSIARI